MRSDYWRNRLTRRSLGRSVALGSVGLGAVALVGCGDDDDDAPATAASGGTTAAGSPTATGAQPKRGGTLRTMSDNDLEGSVDPFQPAGWSDYIRSLLSPVLSNLMQFEFGAGVKPSTKLVPDMATSWEQPDSTTITLKLRDGVKWHDVAPANGRLLDADDVVFSVQRMLASNFGFKQIFGAISKVEAVDPRTAKLTLSAPNADLLVSLGFHFLYLLPKDGGKAASAAPLGRDFSDPSPFPGTGPWILQEYQRGSQWSYKRNPNYFKQGQPYPDELRILVVKDPTARVAQFQNGQIDFVNGVGSSAASLSYLEAQQLSGESRLTIEKALIPATRIGSNLTMNATSGPLRDERVRRALTIIYDPIAQASIGQPPAYVNDLREWIGPVGPDFPDFYLDVPQLGEAGRWWNHKDLKTAKDLLAAAGFTERTQLSIDYNTSACCNLPQTGETIASLIGQASGGVVKVGVKVKEHPLFLSTTNSGQYEGIALRSSTAGFSVDTRLSAFEPISGQTSIPWGGVTDDELVALIKKQRGLLNANERKVVLADIQKLLASRCYVGGQTQGLTNVAWQKRVKGIGPARDRHFEGYWLDA